MSASIWLALAENAQEGFRVMEHEADYRDGDLLINLRMEEVVNGDRSNGFTLRITEPQL